MVPTTQTPPSTQTRQLLSIEDSASDAFLLRSLLESAAGQDELVAVSTLEEGLAWLETCEPDLILLDLFLPDAHGLQGLRRLLQAAPGAPVVVLSAEADEVLASEAVRLGAQEFLHKHELDECNLRRCLAHARERKQLQLELAAVHREQLTRKDMFLSHVSHEFRTPLSAIQQFASILADGLAGPLNAEQLEFLQVVLRNVEELKRMVEELIETTRASSGRLTVQSAGFELAPLVEQSVLALRDRAARAGVQIECELLEKRRVLGDPTRVRQVIGNLMDNALKFTPAGGQVRVQARAAAENAASTVLSVIDTGPGIPEDERDAIFEPMFQSASATADMCRKGLGLGLYICRELMELQGGRVWVEEAPGGGSCFSLELPLYSLPSMLAPLCRQPLCAGESVHLIELQLWHAGETPQRATGGSQIASLRRVVESCTTVDRDVVLPAKNFVRFVSRTLGRSCDLVLARVQRQLMADARLGGGRYVLSVERRALGVPPRGTSSTELADALAAALLAELDIDLNLNPDRLPEESHL